MQTHSFHNMVHGQDNEHTHAMLGVITAGIGIWFLAACVGGMSGIFNQPGVPPVTVGLFVLVPIAGFLAAYGMSPQIRTAIDSIPLWTLTIAHVWRFVGLGFIVGAAAEVLPPQFGYPEGLGDVIAAALCLPLALALRSGKRSPRLRTAFVAWNVFGLVDLLSAITIGVLYSPSTFGVLRADLSTELMTRFPISLIPTFFLPLFILLHLLGLKRSREVA